MKRNANKLVSIFIALSLLLVTFFSVSATGTEKKIISYTLTLPDPTTTLVTGGAKLSVGLLPILDLPGVEFLSSGTPSPKGFPEGINQFEGQGVKLSGLTYGTAKVCFPITSIGQGWGGKVAYWTGAKWQLLDTTITSASEQPYSWACADVTQNGTFSLIVWVVDASKLPVGPTEKPR